MKVETIMRKIQEADLELATLTPEENYDFYIDVGLYTEKIGHYSRMYYNRCEEDGLTIEEAKEQLNKHLRDYYGYTEKEEH